MLARPMFPGSLGGCWESPPKDELLEIIGEDGRVLEQSLRM